MKRSYNVSRLSSRGARPWLVSLHVFMIVSALCQTAYSQDSVPWFEPGTGPSAEVDTPPAVYQPPPPPRPTGALSIDLSPIFHRNSVLSGSGSVVRARLSYQTLSFFAGIQTPGAHFVTGIDINPLGGVKLGAVKLPEHYDLWILGPRVGTSLLIGAREGVRGLGFHGEVTGVRLTRCGGGCSFIDVRAPMFQYMIVTTKFTPEGEPEFVRSLGATISAGIAF